MYEAAEAAAAAAPAGILNYILYYHVHDNIIQMYKAHTYIRFLVCLTNDWNVSSFITISFQRHIAIPTHLLFLSTAAAAAAAANKWCTEILTLSFENVFFLGIIDGRSETESNSNNNNDAHICAVHHSDELFEYLNKIFPKFIPILCVHKISIDERGKGSDVYFQNNFRTRIMANCIKMERNFSEQSCGAKCLRSKKGCTSTRNRFFSAKIVLKIHFSFYV